MVEVTVHYFAMLKEMRECSTESFTIDDGTTVASLFNEIFPPATPGLPIVQYVINQKRTSPETALEDGDSVAFLPPLGGG